MRDLVVARERRVDGGTALHHVAEHAADDHVANDDAESRAQERILAAAVAARSDVAPPLPRSGGQLEHDLPREQHEGARDVVAVGEERAVARVGALLGVHPAHRQDHVVGLPGQKVAAARAAVGEQADPGRAPALDLRAIRRRRARHHVAVSFSTQRNAGMSSFDPSRIPAWLAPVCDERSVSHSASR